MTTGLKHELHRLCDEVYDSLNDALDAPMPAEARDYINNTRAGVDFLKMGLSLAVRGDQGVAWDEALSAPTIATCLSISRINLKLASQAGAEAGTGSHVNDAYQKIGWALDRLKDAGVEPLPMP